FYPAYVNPVNLFPAFLRLAGRLCLVVGAGIVAEEKIDSLLRAGADVRVVAPHATEKVYSWARAGAIRLESRNFRPADLRGAFVVIAATSSPALHKKIYALARSRRVLCNVVDDPENCDFYYGSVMKRGSLQIAISTGGLSPALAQRLRKQFERQFGAEYELWLVEIGRARERLFARKIEPARRKQLLHRLASELSVAEFLRRRNRVVAKAKK
ncbi:MAG: precorrin-2 dehydrogenase/sirohydrochlorin ferrochelatase family protein, partial [Terracidiphilus sp.]